MTTPAEEKPPPQWKPLSLDNYATPTDKAAAGPSDTSFGTYEPGQVWGPRATPATGFGGSADSIQRYNTDWTNSRYNTWMPKADAESMFGSLPEDQQGFFNNLASQSRAWNDTGESVYKKYVARSAALSKQGRRMSPSELALEDFRSANGSDPAGDGPPAGSGPSAYSGPVSAVDNAPALDVRSVADSVAQEMLGRVVTQDEMQRILKRVRTYEENNPTVRTPEGVGASRSSGGATTAGRQQIIERLVAKNPDFMPYQMNHTVYDAMLSVMRRGQEIASG